MYKLTGRVVLIKDKEQLTPTFAKRVVVVIQEGNHQPQYLALEFINDRIKMVDAIKINDDLRVEFTLNGSKWSTRDGKDNYTTSIRPWKVERLTTAKPGDALKEVLGNEQNATTAPQTTVDDFPANF